MLTKPPPHRAKRSTPGPGSSGVVRASLGCLGSRGRFRLRGASKPDNWVGDASINPVAGGWRPDCPFQGRERGGPALTCVERGHGEAIDQFARFRHGEPLPADARVRRGQTVANSGSRPFRDSYTAEPLARSSSTSDDVRAARLDQLCWTPRPRELPGSKEPTIWKRAKKSWARST